MSIVSKLVLKGVLKIHFLRLATLFAALSLVTSRGYHAGYNSYARRALQEPYARREVHDQYARHEPLPIATRNAEANENHLAELWE